MSYEPIVVKGLKNPDGTVIAEYFGKPQIGFVAVRETDASNYPIHGLDDFKIPGMVKGVLEERETVEQHLDRLLCKYGALLYVTYNPSTNVVTQKLQAGQNVYTRTFAYNSWSNWSSDSLVLTSEMNTALAGKANAEHTHDADDVYWNPQGAEHSYPISDMMVSITHDVEQLNTTTQGLQEDVDELKTRANDLEIGKAPLNHLHDINDVNGLSTRLGALDNEIGDLDGRTGQLATALAGKAPLNHVHDINDVNGLSTRLGALDDEVDDLDGRTGQLATALAGKAPLNHTHAIGDVEGLSGALGDLNEALDGKAPLSHTHSIANVTGLQTALDGKLSGSVTNITLGEEDHFLIEEYNAGQLYLLNNEFSKQLNNLIDSRTGNVYYHLDSGTLTKRFILIRFYHFGVGSFEDAFVEVVGAWG